MHWFLSFLPVLITARGVFAQGGCRARPGDVDQDAWKQLNESTSGHLFAVVPSAQFCHDIGGCTDEQWTSSTWRSDNMPGSMLQPNWEQDYDASPPEVCLRNTTGNCKQGNVPHYVVLVESVEEIQASVNFARTNNLRVAIKSSGHDYLGRSTAKDSLLISTHRLTDIAIHDDFNGQGGAVTVGSGVRLNQIYSALKEKGKIFVGGGTATVAAAGGYIQGGGHSSLSPLLGLAADNTLQFTIVTADGQYLTANETENSDLYWALRGGGGGSWGVMVSATFRTFDTFNATYRYTVLTANSTNSSDFNSLMTIHAAHIHDFDEVRAGQYYWAFRNDSDQTQGLYIRTYLPKLTANESREIMQPFLTEALASGTWTVSEDTFEETVVNDIVHQEDANGAENMLMGSRLVPEEAYETPEAIGKMYEELFDTGLAIVLGHIIAGGKVSENANIDSAVHPKWRMAKTHLITADYWTDEVAAPSDVVALRSRFHTEYLPIIEKVVGTGAGAYMNEADPYEVDFATTFYGQENYAKLTEVKSKYDENDLFIVQTGVGSERWDKDGMCKVA